jgi:predicted O-methyltransferase YrrM
MNQTRPVSALIEEAVKDIPGWSPLDQLLTLFTLAYTSADIHGDVLELGSWCGRSAVALGMAVRLSGKGKVHCVDLFPEKTDWYKNSDGSYSFAVQIGEKLFRAYNEQTVWAEPYERDIAPVYNRFAGTLDAFNQAIKQNNLENWVTSVKGDLDIFSQETPDSFSLRLAFIDGDHSYDAVTNDIKIIEKYLLPGGWICFDDAYSSYDGVSRAITDHIINSSKYDLKQQITRKFFIARRRQVSA